MAAVKSTTYQTDGRVLINAIHFNRNSTSTIVEHSWYTFEPDKYLVNNNNVTIIEATVRKSKEPKIVKCPRCGKRGRINQYHPNIKERPDLTKYYVKHEYLPGRWGTGKTCPKIKRFKRCYFFQYPTDSI